MVFYLDLILILNFVIDYFILLVTAKVLNITYRSIRVILGAILGAIYTLVFFISLSFFQIFITKILLSLFMIWISFGYRHLLHFIQTTAVFYVISFVSGGGVLAAQYLFNINHTIVNGIYVSRSSSPVSIILLIILAFFGVLMMSNRTIKSIKRKSNIETKIMDIEIFIDEHSCKCKGLIDTGNQLYDPITRRPVMIIEVDQLPFIPAILRSTYVNGEFQLDVFNHITEEIEPNFLRRIQFVPFKTVMRGMKFLMAIKPDKVVIYTDSDISMVHTKVLLGLDAGQLSNDHSYHAIIHPELIAG